MLFSGEYPETLIDSRLDYPINKLRSALATVLGVHIDLVRILCIRPVFQYQIPYQPPSTLQSIKSRALTNVIFDVSTLNRLSVSETLKPNLNQLKQLSSIEVVAIEPDPCTNYACPFGNSHQIVQISYFVVVFLKKPIVEQLELFIRHH